MYSIIHSVLPAFSFPASAASASRQFQSTSGGRRNFLRVWPQSRFLPGECRQAEQKGVMLTVGGEEIEKRGAEDGRNGE